MVFHFESRLSITKGGEEERRGTVLIAVYQRQRNTNKKTTGRASAKRSKPRIELGKKPKKREKICRF